MSDMIQWHKDKNEIEQMIDRHGLPSILGALSAICSDKAEHIRTNWQDENTAKLWDSANRDLYRQSERAVYTAIDPRSRPDV